MERLKQNGIRRLSNVGVKKTTVRGRWKIPGRVLITGKKPKYLMRFSNKTILLGVTGSIAAYKALELCRQLKKDGADVHVILSEGAKNFVQPLSFQSLSGNDVLEAQFESYLDINQKNENRQVRKEKNGGQGKNALDNSRKKTENQKTQTSAGMKHIDVSAADTLVIAPATANFVAKAAAGLADDLLTTTLQAFSGPVLVAPAMNDVMYAHQVQHRNINRLKELGYAVVEPDSGDLACGRIGQGRLASTDKILARLETLLRPQDLKGRTILVTAGPTREYLDPVRFISNASSGKMGYAIAEAASLRGASVILISGPTALLPPANVKTKLVETTSQMDSKVRKHFPKADVFVSAAAPADFAPNKAAKTKIPKNKFNALELKPTADILSWAGKFKNKGQTVIGFALETTPTIAKARRKLLAKKADAVLLNGTKNVGSDTASGILVFSKGQTKLAKTDKLSFAHALLDAVFRKKENE